MKPSVIVYGPKGCGKTRHSVEIADRYELTKVVEFDELPKAAQQNVPAYGTLILTFEDKKEASKLAMRLQIRALSFELAMTEVLLK